MALHEIIVSTAGGPKENKTILTVGRTLLIEQELNKIKMEMETYKIELDELTEYTKSMFGEELFNNPKEVISMLPSVKKKNCVLMLSKLSKCNKELQEIKKKYNSTVEKYKAQREPSVQILNEIFVTYCDNSVIRRENRLFF